MIDTDDLTKKCDQAISQISTDNTDIDGIIAENYRYYYGEMPAPDPQIDEYGNVVKSDQMGSGYVAPVCWEAVEAIVAAGVETFNATRRPVEFSPPGRPDVEEANDFARVTLWEDNPGVKIIREAMQRAAIAKLGPVAVFWDDSVEKESGEEIIDMGGLQALSGMPDVEITAEEQVDEGAFRVAYEIDVPARRIRIQGIDPELFGIDGEGLGDDEWLFVYHQERVQDEDLIAQGYPKEMVRRLPTTIASSQFGISTARNRIDGSRIDETANPLQDTFPQRIITHAFYRHPTDDGRFGIVYMKYGYQTDVVLEAKEVDDHFYAFAQCYPVAGKCYPLSAVEATKATQVAQSKVMREILNNIDLANHDRTEVNLGMIDPGDRDAVRQVSERLGGTYRVKGPGAISNIPRLPLPGETPLAISWLQQEAESRTGYSRVAMGTAAEVISQQNSATMVDKYIAIGSRRISAMMALNAEEFLTRIYRLIHDAAIQNAQLLDGREVEVDGRVRPITPSRWDPVCRISSKPVLTREDREARAAALIQWDQGMAARAQQIPETRLIYQPHNAAFLYREVADLLGLPVDEILSLPDSPAFQEEAQRMAQEQEQARRMAEAEQAANMAKQEEMATVAREQMEADTAKKLNDIEIAEDKQELDEEAQEHSQIMDMLNLKLKRMELEIEEEQERPVRAG